MAAAVAAAAVAAAAVAAAAVAAAAVAAAGGGGQAGLQTLMIRAVAYALTDAIVNSVGVWMFAVKFTANIALKFTV
jgi:hypothetical protein